MDPETLAAQQKADFLQRIKHLAAQQNITEEEARRRRAKELAHTLDQALKEVAASS